MRLDTIWFEHLKKQEVYRERSFWFDIYLRSHICLMVCGYCRNAIQKPSAKGFYLHFFNSIYFHLLPANEFLMVYRAPLCAHLLSVLEVLEVQDFISVCNVGELRQIMQIQKASKYLVMSPSPTIYILYFFHKLCFKVLYTLAGIPLQCAYSILNLLIIYLRIFVDLNVVNYRYIDSRNTGIRI